MAHYDPELAKRVWSRVQSSTPAEGEGDAPLAELLAGAGTCAAVYRQLSLRMQGAAAHALRRMSEEERRLAACLRGICTLQNGACPPEQPPAPPQGSPQALLRQCYSRERAAFDACKKLSAGGEFGPVFSALAEGRLAHCITVLELLGNMKNP